MSWRTPTPSVRYWPRRAPQHARRSGVAGSARAPCWRRQFLHTEWRNSVVMVWQELANMMLEVNGVMVVGLAPRAGIQADLTGPWRRESESGRSRRRFKGWLQCNEPSPF